SPPLSDGHHRLLKPSWLTALRVQFREHIAHPTAPVWVSGRTAGHQLLTSKDLWLSHQICWNEWTHTGAPPTTCRWVRYTSWTTSSFGSRSTRPTSSGVFSDIGGRHPARISSTST